MQGEIIAIGNELTSGRIINTTSGFAARQLFEAGHDIFAMHTIGDTPKLIGEALKRAIKRVDFVLVTGGLGSTDDDLTNEAVADALNLQTMPNLQILSLIKQHLGNSSTTEAHTLEKLAWLPDGADVFAPESRMSGYQLIHDNTPIFFLPGIPEQMQVLLVEQVLPRLLSWSRHHRLKTRQRVYKIFGLEEREVNQCITSLNLGNTVSVGYYPVFPELHLSLVVRNEADPLESFDILCEKIEQKLGRYIFGYDNDTIENVIGSLLKKHGKTISFAESCTSGLISHTLTHTDGSSAYFLGGIISYSNDMKISLLDVRHDSIIEHGAVSELVAKEMAIGIRKKSSSDIGISVTGIAGPTGGTASKPVGTVYIGFSTKDETKAMHYQFSGNRNQIQKLTAYTALNLLRKYVTIQKHSTCER